MSRARTGCVVNADDGALYVAATRGNSIWRMPFLRTARRRRSASPFSFRVAWGPDRLALTADGGLVVAHIGIGAVWIFDRTGQPLYQVQSPKRPAHHQYGLRRPGRARALHHRRSGARAASQRQAASRGQPMFSHQSIFNIFLCFSKHQSTFQAVNVYATLASRSRRALSRLIKLARAHQDVLLEVILARSMSPCLHGRAGADARGACAPRPPVKRIGRGNGGGMR